MSSLIINSSYILAKEIQKLQTDYQNIKLINFYMKRTNHISVNQQDLCNVCCQRPVNSRLPKCNHKFCFQCIDRWSKKNNSCPHCRDSFTSIITKQKFRKNSKIIREGRLVKNSSRGNTNLLNVGNTFHTVNFRIVYQPMVYFVPAQIFPFPMYSIQYPHSISKDIEE